MKSNLLKKTPLFLFIFLLILFYILGGQNYFTFEALRNKHLLLKQYVENHYVIAPLIFIGVYSISTALSLPIGILLSLAGGFLFPQPWSTLYVVIGATLGAVCLFLAAKTAFGSFLKKKAGPLLLKIEKGFQKDAASYLLFLRFVPLFPFWLVNLAPAFFNVSLITFTWTTCIGILPGAFVFTQAGRGLEAIFESNGSFAISSIFNNQMKIALACLALFSLTPIIIKKIRAKK